MTLIIATSSLEIIKNLPRQNKKGHNNNNNKQKQKIVLITRTHTTIKKKML